MATRTDALRPPAIRTAQPEVQGLPHDSKPWVHRPPMRGETTPEVARESRRWRVGMRLLLPDVWQARLHGLSHHDPAYAYDELYEYEDDWTTDPNYAGRVSQASEYDKEGFVVPTGSRHQDFITFLKWVLTSFLGSRVVREPELHIPARVGELLELVTESGKPKRMYKPDLLVLADPLDTERERARSEYEIRMDRGHPAPMAAIEVLSETSVQRDSEEKHAVYAALGIKEYLVVDPGEPPDPDEPESTGTDPGMTLYRLTEDGSEYRNVDHEAPPHVCGVGVRLVVPDDGEAPFPVMLQWRDPDTGVWREPVNDTRQEGRNLGRAEGVEEGRGEGEALAVLNLLPALLGSVLSVDEQQALSDHWKEHGVPADYQAVVQELQANPALWRNICGIPQESS